MRRLFPISFILCLSASIFAATVQITENFDSDPGWEGLTNTENGNNYGYRTTHLATTDALTLVGGEVGGIVANSEGYYADDIGSLDPTGTVLTASGRWFSPDYQDGHCYIGWFNSTTFTGGLIYDHFPRDMIGFYTEGFGGTGASAVLNPTVAGSDGDEPVWHDSGYDRPEYGLPCNSYQFSFEMVYDPNGGAQGHGTLTVTIFKDGVQYGRAGIVNLLAGEKDKIRNLDRFGIWSRNYNLPTRTQEIYWDELTYAAGMPEDSALSITVDAVHPGAPIPAELWGQNTMWLWFNEYFEGQGDAAYIALKNDVKAMRVTSLRYPGGGLANTFHWEKAIGPMNERPAQLLGTTPYGAALFGIDEFLRFCEEVGAEPVFTLQFRRVGEAGHDTSIKRAVAWVAYCNGDRDDPREIGTDADGFDWRTIGYWARLRADPQYGNHPESYGVKFWEVGNEPWGNSPYDPATNAATYCTAWAAYHQALSAIDPNLWLSLAGFEPETSRGDEQWDAELIRTHGNTTNFYHFHPYFPYGTNNTDPEWLYRLGASSTAGLRVELNLLRDFMTRLAPGSRGRLKVGATEWAAVYDSGQAQTTLRDTAVRWTGTMSVADQLGAMTENTDLIEMAHYWMLMPGNFCVFEYQIQPHGRYGHFRHGLYEVFRHYANFYGDQRLMARVDGSPTYYFPGYQKGWGSPIPAGNYPYVSAYASQDSTARYLVVLNKDPLSTRTGTIAWDGLDDATNRITIRTIHASTNLPNYSDINTNIQQPITTTVSKLTPFQPSMTYPFPPCSMTGFIVERAKPSNPLRRREVEDVFTVYENPEGSSGVDIGDGQLDSGQHVRLAEAGRAILVPFNLHETGYYTPRLRLQTGIGTQPTILIDHHAYQVSIDGKTMDFSLVSDSLSEVDAQGAAVWGTMHKPWIMLSPGRHYLQIRVGTDWGRIDWLEIVRERLANFEAENNYTVVHNSSDSIMINDLGLDSNEHLQLRPGDRIQLHFDAPIPGVYELQLRQRVGIHPDSIRQCESYGYYLDRMKIKPDLELPTISRLDNDQSTYWGTVIFPTVFLDAGKYTLDVEFQGEADARLDYLTIVHKFNETPQLTSSVDHWEEYRWSCQ